MITQLAAYGSFIPNQSVAYNKSEPESVFYVTRQFEMIFFLTGRRKSNKKPLNCYTFT
ncbi:conserved hypothetical protein [Klebsiella quasipneumoniae subsp. similipneumoniae]|nr:conserved hypothetical protein [Klebsiella quasipneumoniae subsp. similipneumoniae]